MEWNGRTFHRQPMKVKQMVILVCNRVATHNITHRQIRVFLYKKLCPQVHKVQPMLWQPDVIILHNNVQPHYKDYVLSVFCEYGWETLPHSPYSPNMESSPDCNMFQKLKKALRGVRFRDLTVLNNDVSWYICELNSGKLFNSTQRLLECWRHVTESQGALQNGCK